jgi:hypothetical protein
MIVVAIVIGLYVFGKSRYGEWDWRRDGTAILGLVILGLVLALVFSGPGPLARLVPPMFLTLGGGYLAFVKPSTDRMQRTVGWLALASGVIWVALGLVTLTNR